MINLQSEHTESRERKDFSNLVIFTGTSYQDDERSQVRSKLALKMLDNAEKCGIKVVIVDKQSGTKFIDQLKKYDNVTIITAKGGDTMAWDRRRALKTALEFYPKVPYFLWTEPEKDNFVTPQNLSPIIDEIETGKYAIVVPKRADKSTMVDFQAREETRANKELSALATGKKRTSEQNTDLYRGEEFDFFFGPKIMTREGARYFLEYKGKLDKRDGTITPVLLAKANGENIGSATVNYDYDVSQVENERGDRSMDRKRLSQYVEILNETKQQLLNIDRKEV